MPSNAGGGQIQLLRQVVVFFLLLFDLSSGLGAGSCSGLGLGGLGECRALEHAEAAGLETHRVSVP
jgi:hypothetical protein